MTENVPQTAAPRPVSLAQLTVQALSALSLFAIFGADFVDAVRFPTAELAAFSYPPSLWLNAVAMLLTLFACGVALKGHLKKLGGDYRGFRLLPIVAVVFLFVNFVVLSSARSPISASDQAHIAIFELARRINDVARVGAVPSTQREVEGLMNDMVMPPYWVKGVQVKAFGLEVRSGCKGPATEVNGAPPATLIYCVGEGAKEGWVTLVGLPMSTRFGAPTIVTRGGLPVAAEVHGAPPPEPSEEPTPKDLQLPGTRWEDISPPVQQEAPAEPQAPDAG